MKSCSEPGCNYPVFSKGLCRSHWQYKHGRPIPKRTKKRGKQEKEYLDKRQQFIEKKRQENHGILVCIFCGKRIFGMPDIHHLMGRDDETLLDERFWGLAHNKCHVYEYHSKSWQDIEWWDNYLDTIRSDYPQEILEKELKRMNK